MNKSVHLRPMELLLQSVEAIGSEKTCEVLQKGINSNQSDKKRIFERIISIVAREFSLKKEDILHRSGNATDSLTIAVQIVCYMGRIHFTYSQSQMGRWLDYHVSSVNKNITRISKLDALHPEDKKIIDCIARIEPKITELKKEVSNG